MKIHLPVVGPDLPVHPRIGFRAIGMRRNGDPIWPVMGGAPDDGDGDGGDSGGDDGAGDRDGDQGDGSADNLGDAGKQAIARMKTERNAARKELRDVRSQLEKLAPLQKLAEALGGSAGDDGDGKPDVDGLAQRLARHEADLQAERLARFRAEVAHEKGLTAGQAKRLVGATREELTADADELLKEFKPTDGNGTRRNGPRPDPSQGSRGGKPLSGREAAIAEAAKRFGTKSTT